MTHEIKAHQIMPKASAVLHVATTAITYKCLFDVNSKVLKQRAGFTLVEVLVAVFILASVAVVSIQAGQSYTQAVARQTLQTQAHWVLMNQSIKMQLEKSYLTADTHQAVQAFGQQWDIHMQPTAFKVPNLPTAQVQQVTLTAFLINAKQKQELNSLVVVQHKD